LVERDFEYDLTEPNYALRLLAGYPHESFVKPLIGPFESCRLDEPDFSLPNFKLPFFIFVFRFAKKVAHKKKNFLQFLVLIGVSIGKKGKNINISKIRECNLF